MSSRSAVLIRTACLLGVAVGGLLLWGRQPLNPALHQYADTRAWLGVPNAANVLVNVPIFWLAVWGWCATRTSQWPRALRLPWQWFHIGAIAAAISAAMYHAAPGDALFLTAHCCVAGAFLLLACGMLAERVDARFGSMTVCMGVVVTTALANVTMVYASRSGVVVDLRALILCESTPILLVLAGLLRLRGAHTRASGWMLSLALYAVANFVELGDSLILRASGVVSGHTLMHGALALVVGWIAYRATAARSDPTLAGAAFNQRQTSLNTTG